jgi:hypothetical protein
MQRRPPAIVGPAHHQIAQVHGQRAVDDRHRHPTLRAVHDLEPADVIVGVDQRHHAEVAMRPGAQLPRQWRRLRRWIVHDSELADVLIDLVVEKFRREIESRGEDAAQGSSDTLEFMPVRLQRRSQPDRTRGP